MYLLSQINKNPAITTVIKRGIFGGGKGLLSSSLRNIKALLIYETGSLGSKAEAKEFAGFPFYVYRAGAQIFMRSRGDTTSISHPGYAAKNSSPGFTLALGFTLHS